jgi:hypothetical protein
MRVGPLSNSKVISLLNHYFIPVYVSNEDYFGKGAMASAEERAERQRLVAEFGNKGLGTGDVHVYILSPDGHAAAGLDIGSAMDTNRLTQLLEGVVKKFGTRSGEPVIPPAVQSSMPPADSASAVFYVVTRRFEKNSPEDFPGENWIVLGRGEWQKLLPPQAANPGATWILDKEVTTKLLTTVYPPTEDTSSADRNHIERQELRLTMLPAQPGVSRARIDGSLKMKRSYYPNKPDDRFVDATLLGFAEFDRAGSRIQALQLVTKDASYAGDSFGAAMRMTQPATE